MKRIKQKIEALLTLGHSPSDAIRGAWDRIRGASSEVGVGDTALVGGLIADIVAIAEDMEKAAKDSEAKS